MIKRANINLILLLANLVLVLLVAWHYRPAPRSDSERGGVASAKLLASTRPSPTLRVVKTNILESNPFHWSQIEADDYKAYIERLRGIGCPEQTIRDLIIADIDKIFAERLHAINPAAREIKYWQPEDKGLETSDAFRERQRQQREVDFSKRQIIKDLLGVDLVSERNKVQGTEDQFGRRLGFLPDDKRSQTRMVLEHYNDEELAIRQKTWEEGEPLTDEDKARLKELQKQRDEAIAKTLSPQELAQYELTMSPLAYQVRDSLFGMKPTEQEYVTIYGLQKDYQQKWPDPPDPNDPPKRAQWEQDTAELKSQLKEKLGETRYAEYQRAQDADYRELIVAAARYQISPTVAAEVYEYKSVVEEQRARVAGNRSLTPDQQQAALAAMASETETTVKAALGEKAFNAYLRSGRGEWIQGPPR